MSGSCVVSDSGAIDWALDTETQDGKAILVGVAHTDGYSRYFEPTGWAGHLGVWAWLRGIDRAVAFNMDYDARALLKFLPRRCWMELYRDETTEYEAMGFTWKITYKPARELSIQCGENSFHLYDIYQHFQCSLRAACQEVLRENAKGDIPQAWYSEMEARLADARTRKRVIEYCVRDARATIRLWKVLETQYRKLGVPEANLVRPISPGSIAVGYFGEKIKGEVDYNAQWLARRAYVGGRIEVYQRGYFPRVWVYDLKSAYPWAISFLPDPRDLRAVRDKRERADAVYSCYRVKVQIPLSVKIPPIAAWGESDRRIYPVGAWTTWVTGPERELLEREKWVVDVTDGIHLCGFRKAWGLGIEKLFRLRKTRPEISLAIKLVLNSLYGKMAQINERLASPDYVTAKSRKIGGKWVTNRASLGSQSNFFVASYVTALVRLRMWAAMRGREDSVVLAATDGLMLTRPLPRAMIGDGSRLGDWTVKAAGIPAVVVGSGVYAVKDGGEWEDRMRGFRLQKPLVTYLDTSRTKVKATTRMAYTIADFATKGADMNAMVDVDRTLDVNFDEKRRWPKPWKHARQLLRENQSSLPRILFDKPKSV